MKLKTLLLQFVLCLSALSGQATDYFITSAGDDTNPGTSPAQAWRSVTRISAVSLQPSDRVLLAGGQTFVGNIRVRRSSRGTVAEPIVFRSYGPGRATIASGSDMGFYAHNLAGIELRNLAFIGAGRTVNQASGRCSTTTRPTPTFPTWTLQPRRERLSGLRAERGQLEWH